MNLNLVRTFSRVVEAQSFTAAARSLGLPKSSVSRAVTQLEDHLGARLLERTSRQLKLTDAGRAYYDEAARAIATLSEAEQLVSESQGEPRGSVRLSVPVAADRCFFSDLVTRFRQQYPAIRVDVSFANRTVDLVGEEFDLGIRGARNGQIDGGSSLIARKIGEKRLWLFAAPSYLKGRDVPRRPADLANHDLVLFDHQCSGARVWELKGPNGVEPVDVSGAVSSDDFLFIREMVIRGAGITLMPPRIDDLRSGALVRVLPEYEVPDLSIYLVMPSNQHLPRRVALFRDALIEAFKRWPMALDASMASVRPTGT